MIEKLGTLNVVSGAIMAADPCYGTDVWCLSKIEGVLNGTYKAKIIVKDCDEWGKRVSVLQILHTDFKKKDLEVEYDSTCGVDSGTFSFSDYQYYTDYHSEKDVDDEWYDDFVCGMDENGHIVEDRMAMSRSGFGDGGYEVYTLREKKNGYIVGAYVKFI